MATYINGTLLWKKSILEAIPFSAQHKRNSIASGKKLIISQIYPVELLL
jgi:hypothetical protein